MPVISVVDDDIWVRESLDSLIRSIGYEVRVFASAEAFLNSADHRTADCLILDVCLPAMSGTLLHRNLLASGCTVPVIFVTAHASDERARSETASAYTVAYLIKPFTEAELLGAVAAALSWKPVPSPKTAKPRSAS